MAVFRSFTGNKSFRMILPFSRLFRAPQVLTGCCMAFLLLSGCASSPYAGTNRQYRQQAKRFAAALRKRPEVAANDSVKAPAGFVGTTNFSMRKPNFVMLHYTDQTSCAQTLQTFTLPRTEVSAHYVICKDGTVHHMLNDYLRAHHAGTGRWGQVTDMNSSSIGIELDNNGSEPFAEAQLASLLSLLGQLKRAYNIPAANFIGHSDYAPARKRDPGILFPWKRLADAGFGRWYASAPVPAPAGFDYLLALRVIGYDTRDTAAAITAFRQHFLQDSTGRMDEAGKSVLYNLQQQ
jgi:N-acetylmuramoyl-L-alanine amidase